ncbi:MAG: hypothetical protein ACFFDT_37475 [Candidatus Hodarchaeota archaeon]
MRTWKPDYHQFQELFANDYCLKILILIAQKSQMEELPCAADIAKILDIHISTATKYLDLLYNYEFIDKKQFIDRPGKPTYYELKSFENSIKLDLLFMNQTLQQIFDITSLPNPLLREKANLPPRVEYTYDNEQIIREIVVKKRTKARRVIQRKFILSEAESDFMAAIPYPTMETKHFLEVCTQAGITDYFTLKEIYSFLQKLEKYQIIELEK